MRPSGSFWQSKEAARTEPADRDGPGAAGSYSEHFSPLR